MSSENSVWPAKSVSVGTYKAMKNRTRCLLWGDGNNKTSDVKERNLNRQIFQKPNYVYIVIIVDSDFFFFVFFCVSVSNLTFNTVYSPERCQRTVGLPSLAFHSAVCILRLQWWIKTEQLSLLISVAGPASHVGPASRVVLQHLQLCFLLNFVIVLYIYLINKLSWSSFFFSLIRLYCLRYLFPPHCGITCTLSGCC